MVEHQPSAQSVVETEADKNARIEGSLISVYQYILGLTQEGVKVDDYTKGQLAMVRHFAEVGLGYKPDTDGDEMRKRLRDDLKKAGYGTLGVTDAEINAAVSEMRINLAITPRIALQRFLKRKGISYSDGLD